MIMDDAQIELAILQQVASTRSVAPRDIALALASEGQDWRPFLLQIKRIACRLAEEGQLVLLRKRKSVLPSELKGVYRVASPAAFQAHYSETDKTI